MSGLLENARSHPNRPAVIFGDGDGVETYAELESRSRRIAHALLTLGLRPGDCVALLLGNEESYMDLCWATQRIGLYFTPLNWHASLGEIAVIIDDSDANVVIVGASFREMGMRLRAARGESKARFLSVQGEIPGFESLDALAAGIPPDQGLQAETAGSIMIYSSGTTGRPKGIRRPLLNRAPNDPRVTSAQTRILRIFGFGSAERYLCPAPLYHAAPLRSCTAVHVLGGTVIALKRFDARTALRTIQSQRVTTSQWVPTHFKRLLDLEPEARREFDLSTLRLALHAAAPCPIPLKRAMIDWWGPILLEYYAGTEGGGTIIDSHDWLAHPGSVGKPWRDVEVGIFDEDLGPVKEPRVPGSIYFADHVPGSRFVYYKNEELTHKVYNGDWFTLGDNGYLDEEGFLYLTDRQSNMIISGGVNIYPQEVENCLVMHPKVFDAAVIGVPDEEMGEQVRAVVIPAPGIAPSAELAAELIEFTRRDIAHYKCPTTVSFVRELPRTETGKLQKRRLRELFTTSG